ncbi:F-box/WD repeat-containing protein pof10 isoform X2 [Sorghum bicolor]|uniref:F-box/WD repeat-containing protein pof10 isoform X2 n=1 Tax=Sorghum bicolor TaxID=4558 RepID=UPI000B425CD2|nr:F-box/WD repeat-containing protein pof10 isoform X2 [Sorghum bicolor]|eukprot:XP_021315582.1 F-box/WD repeat-containing protein pof10 isoform X2 [Sorghum bicolor]
MDGLPRELCLKIFHLLDHQSLASAPQVCRKWSALTSDGELWRKLFNDRWGADAAAFYAPEGDKSWKDVFVVQDRGVRIIREGKDYYLIYQGEIQRYLGSRQDTDTDGDCGKDAPRQDAGDEHRQISNRILFFLGDLEKACADAKRVKA